MKRACQHPTRAITQGGELSSLLAELKERSRQRAEVEVAALAGMEDIASLDWARIEKASVVSTSGRGPFTREFRELLAA